MLQRPDRNRHHFASRRHGDQQLFPAELDLARTQRDELVAVVTLYRALGGGWRLAVPDWSAPPDKSAAGEKPPGE